MSDPFIGTANSTLANNFFTWVVIMIKGVKSFAFKKLILNSKKDQIKINVFLMIQIHPNYLYMYT